jgi:hypothetical protein
MLGFDSFFFNFVFPIFFGFEMEKQKTKCFLFFLNGYDQSRWQKNKKTT